MRQGATARARAHLCLRPAPPGRHIRRAQHADRSRPARSAPGAGAAGLRPDLPRRDPERGLTIAGNVRVTLHVQSDCPDTDFVAKLIELQPDGCAMLLMDGVVRAMYRDPVAGPQPLQPSRIYQMTIGLGDICHTFGPAAASKSTSPARTSRAAPATPTAATQCSRTTATTRSGSQRMPCTTPPPRPLTSSFRYRRNSRSAQEDQPA